MFSPALRRRRKESDGQTKGGSRSVDACADCFRIERDTCATLVVDGDRQLFRGRISAHAAGEAESIAANGRGRDVQKPKPGEIAHALGSRDTPKRAASAKETRLEAMSDRAESQRYHA